VQTSRIPEFYKLSVADRVRLVREKGMLSKDDYLALSSGEHTLKVHHADRMIEKLRAQADAIIVEVHAEATSEKQALGWYLDGRVTAVLGTHTHVPTADACILPKGTAFMCDVGMTGPYASVLGREVAPVLGRFIDGMPRRFEVAEGDVRISGALVEYDEVAKRATKVSLITVRRAGGR